LTYRLRIIPEFTIRKQLMIILGFDTATPQCSVALLKGEALITREQNAPGKHTDYLLPLIHECLSEAGIALSAVDLIAFGQGPGSFMGVRLAATVAQGLAYSIGCSVVPVSTLRVLAQTAYTQLNLPHVISGWDARMQEIYYGCYELDLQGLMQVCQQDQCVAPAALALPESMRQWPGVGNAWTTYDIPIVSHTLFPAASDLVTLALDECEKGNALSPLEAKPVYLRGIN
jgi:tRNA threonylcarbamoyladenosine biosynthesis protein TsaB